MQIAAAQALLEERLARDIKKEYRESVLGARVMDILQQALLARKQAVPPPQVGSTFSRDLSGATLIRNFNYP